MEGGENIMSDMEKRVWTAAEVNNFPDSSFAYISEGGKKDSEGKTVPRSLRHLPYKDANGKIDPAHVRNALARLPQTDIPESAKASARAKLVVAAKEVGIDVSGKVDDAKGGEDNMIKKTVSTTEIVSDKEIEEFVEKAGVSDKAAYMECMKQHMKDGMDMAEAAKKCKMEQHKADPSEPIDKPKEEEAAPEVPKEEAPAAEVVAEEVPAEEKPVEDKPAEAVAEADKATDLIKQVLAKVEALEASLQKKDGDDEPASPEGAASKEEVAPEGGVVETPKEEKAPASPSTGGTEDASPEGAEVAKVGESLTKISSQLEKLEETVKKFEGLEARVNKLEEQPAPSKVVSPQLVSKTGSGDDKTARLEEIKKELAELEIMKVKDLDRFQKERKWEKAWDLIKEKEFLSQV